MQISKELARCVAKISGDGYLYYRYIRYNNTCDALLEEFKSDILHLFGPINFTEGKTNTNTPFVQIHGKKIIKVFLDVLPDFHSDFIQLPNIIKKSTKEIKSAYLRAFYDDEGCASLRLYNKTNEWKRNLTLGSNSLNLLKDIKFLLENDFGITSNKIIQNHQGRDRCFILSITGKENFIKFQEQINFKHPKKIRNLNLMIKSYSCTYKTQSKFNELRADLER
jgi:intein/homing endonuclease